MLLVGIAHDGSLLEIDVVPSGTKRDICQVIEEKINIPIESQVILHEDGHECNDESLANMMLQKNSNAAAGLSSPAGKPWEGRELIFVYDCISFTEDAAPWPIPPFDLGAIPSRPRSRRRSRGTIGTDIIYQTKAISEDMAALKIYIEDFQERATQMVNLALQWQQRVILMRKAAVAALANLFIHFDALLVETASIRTGLLDWLAHIDRLVQQFPLDVSLAKCIPIKSTLFVGNVAITNVTGSTPAANAESGDASINNGESGGGDKEGAEGGSTEHLGITSSMSPIAPTSSATATATASLNFGKINNLLDVFASGVLDSAFAHCFEFNREAQNIGKAFVEKVELIRAEANQMNDELELAEKNSRETILADSVLRSFNLIRSSVAAFQKDYHQAAQIIEEVHASIANEVQSENVWIVEGASKVLHLLEILTGMLERSIPMAEAAHANANASITELRHVLDETHVGSPVTSLKRITMHQTNISDCRENHAALVDVWQRVDRPLQILQTLHRLPIAYAAVLIEFGRRRLIYFDFLQKSKLLAEVFSDFRRLEAARRVRFFEDLSKMVRPGIFVNIDDAPPCFEFGSLLGDAQNYAGEIKLSDVDDLEAAVSVNIVNCTDSNFIDLLKRFLRTVQQMRKTIKSGETDMEAYIDEHLFDGKLAALKAENILLKDRAGNNDRTGSTDTSPKGHHPHQQQQQPQHGIIPSSSRKGGSNIAHNGEAMPPHVQEQINNYERRIKSLEALLQQSYVVARNQAERRPSLPVLLTQQQHASNALSAQRNAPEISITHNNKANNINRLPPPHLPSDFKNVVQSLTQSFLGERALLGHDDSFEEESDEEAETSRPDPLLKANAKAAETVISPHLRHTSSVPPEQQTNRPVTLAANITREQIRAALGETMQKIIAMTSGKFGELCNSNASRPNNIATEEASTVEMLQNFDRELVGRLKGVIDKTAMWHAELESLRGFKEKLHDAADSASTRNDIVDAEICDLIRRLQLTRQNEDSATLKEGEEPSQSLYNVVRSIVVRDFRAGSVALFLPTTRADVWGLFHVHSPHYYMAMSEGTAERKREWMIGKITSITEKIVTSEDNPLRLPMGLRHFVVEANEIAT